MKKRSLILIGLIVLFCTNTSFSQEQPKLANGSQGQPARENNASQNSAVAPQEIAPYGKSTSSAAKNEEIKIEKAPVIAPMEKKD